MYIRIKRVRKKNGKVYDYAHLIEGVWKKKKKVLIDGKKSFKGFNNSVQKYRVFLGRVYICNITNSQPFENFFGCEFNDFVRDNNVEQVYLSLVKYELLIRGFKEINEKLIKDGFVVDLKKKSFSDSSRELVFKLGERGGYLCNYTLEKVLEVKKIKNKQEGINLMKNIKSAGIKLDGDQFFALANKLLEKTNA